ncbi:MAG: M20/M25/M40 family metallo-hydrolase [Sphingomonadaceae bacterium]
MRHVAGLALLLLAAPANAAPEPPIEESALRQHIAYLADDALEGRKPGTEGGNKAAFYVAQQLQRAGLRPGAPGGGWYQPVPLTERIPLSATQSWQGAGGAFTLSPGSFQFTARNERIALDKVDVIFAGYGREHPEKSFADLKGIDVRGKVVLLLSGKPKGVDDVPGLEVRRQAIARAGATAVLALTGANDPWDLIHDQLEQGRTTLTDDIHAPLEGAIAFPAWNALLKAGGVDSAKLAAAAAQPGFRAVSLNLSADIAAQSRLRSYVSVNVIAKLAGESRPEEAVLYLAHWDHLGLCRPAGVPDRICNGAVDNASGIAVMIEAARRLADGPRPQRSIYFVATTAEEMGLYGARVLAAQPPVPRDRIAGALNLDTVAIAPAGEPVAVIGRGRTRLDPVIDRAVLAQDRKIDRDEAANAFITRQDGWELLKAGIPTVMLGGGFSDPVRLATFLAGDYHKPSDDLDRAIPLDGAAEDGALYVALGRMMADPAELDLPDR